MINDTYLDKKISVNLIQMDKEKKENHIPSGKLSASMLWWPLQWQILKMKGVPPKEFDEYVLRKFLRGNHVEDWLIEQMGNSVIDTQCQVEYRDVIGFIDAIVDMKLWENKLGIIPHEIKSVSNAKYRNILRQKSPDKAHLLQACLYAMATGKKHFAIDYVATDDYRVTTYIYKTEDYQDEVEKIIDEFNRQLEIGVPVFEPREKWQAKAEYNNYPDWMELTEEEISNKLGV